MIEENREDNVDLCIAEITDIITRTSDILIGVKPSEGREGYHNYTTISKQELAKMTDEYNILNQDANLALLGKNVLAFYVYNHLYDVETLPNWN